MERRASAAIVADELPERGEPAGRDRIAFGPLSELAGFMLRLAQVQVYEAFFSEFDSLGVRPGQIGILIAIGKNPGIRQGALAKALHIKRSNMAKTVRRLEHDGLIERIVPESDRRAVELHLTRSGQTLIDRVLPDLRANDRRATGVLSAGERTTLLRLLRKIATAEPTRPRP